MIRRDGCGEMLWRRAVLAVVAWMAALGASAAHAQMRPNLVFVLADDVRFDDVGYSGHPFVKTPNIDRIAREGVVFDNAFAATPLCSPSRASFLTGLYTHHHGIVDNVDHSELSHQLNTFPRQLHDVGYETAFIGKWHMGVDDSPRPGFDHWVSVKGQGRYFDPTMNIDGQARQAKGYVTDLFNERAVAFVRRERTKPFVLYLAQKAVHPDLEQAADGSVVNQYAAEFLPAPRHRSLYRDAPVPHRPNHGMPPVDKPALMRQIGDLPPLGLETGTDDETVRNRLRMLASLDDGVGLLLEALADNGQLDQTIFVFTSDHGYFYGEHGLNLERRLAYEETARIPLAIRYPPLIKAGTHIAQLVQTIDLAPTLLELCGTRPTTPVDGVSLVPLLGGEQVPWRDAILIEYFSDKTFERMDHTGYEAIRDGRYKYIRYRDLQGMDELYDLDRDPYEMANMARDPGSAKLLASLREKLDQLMAKEP